MWRLALQQILHDRVRSGLTMLAICAAIAVTLILHGFEQGLYVQSKKVVMDRGGQLFLAQAGVANFLAVEPQGFCLIAPQPGEVNNAPQQQAGRSAPMNDLIS